MSDDRLTKERVALESVVLAWEALPEGHHRPAVVAQWIRETMAPAIRQARAALAVEPSAVHPLVIDGVKHHSSCKAFRSGMTLWPNDACDCGAGKSFEGKRGATMCKHMSEPFDCKLCGDERSAAAIADYMANGPRGRNPKDGRCLCDPACNE